MVYLIHFDTPLAHARHYVGYCEDGRLEQRLEEHRRGEGANILRVCNERGISYDVVRTWEGADRARERKIKNTNHVPYYCPVCRQAKKM